MQTYAVVKFESRTAAQPWTAAQVAWQMIVWGVQVLRLQAHQDHLLAPLPKAFVPWHNVAESRPTQIEVSSREIS